MWLELLSLRAWSNRAHAARCFEIVVLSLKTDSWVEFLAVQVAYGWVQMTMGVAKGYSADDDGSLLVGMNSLLEASGSCQAPAGLAETSFSRQSSQVLT